MTDEQRLTHLLDRARRGALLPAEGEQLAVLVGELEKSAAINAEVDAQADEQLNGAREVAQHYKAVAEQAQAWGEQHRDRANRYRARTEAVRAELNAMRRDMGSSEDDGMSTAVSRIQAALQSVSHETPVPDDPRVTELEAAVARLRNFRNRWAAHAGRLIGRAVTAEARVTELEAEVARPWGDRHGPTPEEAAVAVRSALPHVQGRCPACGNERLFLGNGGHVTCPRIDCPNPTGADDLLHNRAPDWSTKPATV